MESSDQDNKKKYVAVAISGVIIFAVIGAWVFLYFKKKAGRESYPDEAAVEMDKDDIVKKDDITKAEKVKANKVDVDSERFVNDTNIDRGSYEELKERVEKSYKESEGDLAKRSHNYFLKLLGFMSSSLEKAQNADSSHDLVTAYAEYQSLEKMIEDAKKSQTDYDEYDQLNSELRAFISKASDRQGEKYAKDTFRKAAIAMGRAAEAASAGQFISAIESLQNAMNSLNLAMAELDEIVVENWSKGNVALNNGDNVESNAAFVTVKNIDSVYPGIDDAIKRSETIHIVHPMEQKALEYEKNNLLEMANSLYGEILVKDDLSHIAHDGEKRTGSLLKNRAISSTIVALNEAVSQNLWMKAKGLLDSLKALNPNDERIVNYERMIDNEIAGVKIDQLRWEGAEAEKKKEWDVAVEKYEEILIINPDLADAKESYKRAKLGRSYHDAALDAVERARTFADRDEADDLKKAIHLLNKASDLTGLNKELAEEIGVLQYGYKKRLEQLDRPVSFILISDGKTSIKFWQVGQYEPFTRKGFTLKPGKYTIQGLRKGYREKYINFDVKPGKQNQLLEIVCDEKI